VLDVIYIWEPHYSNTTVVAQVVRCSKHIRSLVRRDSQDRRCAAQMTWALHAVRNDPLPCLAPKSSM
jgi:hypothetical protein